MDREIHTASSDTQPEAHLPWHKPEIQRITVSLDSAGVAGTNIDGLGGSTLFG